MPQTSDDPLPPVLPVILAGGSGTRLWPLSRKHYAKQYLSLDGETTLLQATVARIAELPCTDPLVICNEETRFLAAEQMRQAGHDGALILLEPAGRNTAPAIALAALQAQTHGDDPVMLVMPADHKMADPAIFADAVRTAIPFAQAGQLVTFGISPSRAETGYGYIRTGDVVGQGPALAVAAFVEKPDAETAARYLATGAHLWNSGIFLFRASRYLAELETHRPDVMTACRAAFAGKTGDLDFLRFDADAFLACPDVSIDYAVMEYTSDAVVMPIDPSWSDIGSWAALWDASDKDADGNCEIGDVLSLHGSGNYINAGSRLVTAVGLQDTVVVETKDAVFVAPKDRVSEIKDLIAQMTAEGRPELDHHRVVYRPWGMYDSVDMGDRYQVKRITVNPGAKLSLQKHHHRAEHWIVVRGCAKVTRGDETLVLSENQSTYIPLGEIHALENPGKIPLELIEVQSGSYLGEDDIERFEDRYGRA
ncbi:mannose-1-phosphate guanylyltransferase/mannose-6-phosphate isomerase [Roseobacter sp. CCS2]|uniref:mannose-1-phosphate guanylyltransferase/mannose-6-phosphate isomerase n=1 Tax=Roseobacter sp. CCS2 TaxID=391593 RepID=UPI0000F3E5D2|nr:mannose-1-phosphate guanylyltransferase/mannose-6-phosphate isomerase [Roseobacter sp. CCS2]EBA11984.1 phosphomannose isomerase/GDP-mannose pyrophosphorylase [Roseobacter sp. CCS2]